MMPLIRNWRYHLPSRKNMITFAMESKSNLTKHMRLLFSCTFLFLLTTSLSAQNQEEKVHLWSIQASFGGITLSDESPEGQHFYSGEDQGNSFLLTADYFLIRRLALTGGIYWEQDGLMTAVAHGIGKKKVNMAGVLAGAKFYFFPTKWIIQPHVGASIMTNFLNLSNQKGSGTFRAEQVYPGSYFQMDYDVQCPALTITPRLGVDIRLFSTVSLCLDGDLRFGLWGHNRYSVRYIDGPMGGKTSLHVNDNMRQTFNIGVKVDFPTKKISEHTRNNLMLFLYSLFASRN